MNTQPTPSVYPPRTLCFSNHFDQDELVISDLLPPLMTPLALFGWWWDLCVCVCVYVCPSRIEMPVVRALCSNKMIGGFPASVSDKLNNRNEILHQPSWPPFFFFRPSPALIIFINGLCECIWDVHKPLTFECSVFSCRLSLPVRFYRELGGQT